MSYKLWLENIDICAIIILVKVAYLEYFSKNEGWDGVFYDNEMRFLQKMLDKCHIPYAVIDPESPLDSGADTQLQRIMRNQQLANTLYDMVPDFKSATVYRMLDFFLFRYIFLSLPYCEQPSVLLIGPYLNNEITQQQILEQAEKLGLLPGDIRELEMFYSTVPVVREEHHLFAMVNTFAEYVFSGENNYSSVDLYYHDSASSAPDFFHNRPAEIEGLDAEVMENRYQFENELIDAVSQGNVHKAELMMASFSNLSFESRTSDQLRNLKNYCIIMNTLLRKAAEKGRVHPVHLDRVSSDFARRIEAIRSLSSISDFMLEMMRSYCRLVKRHSMRNYSPLVQKVMIRIESDLTGDLSLRTVAAKHNVSSGYLSGLFKRETGQPFTAYVNSRRIAMAKHLLKTTHLQIQTIAQHCGILDFHYFCRVFKNSTGMTPSEYRSKHIYD